ncbi:MAG: hypothetical protein DMD55_09310 [Gemmatimonadetes bacterium]|nr:MAG: hypothetical protein DMD55_09310 [Gemmatimonadota bacterium]
MSTRTVRIAIVVAGLMVVSTSAQAQRRMRGGRAVRVERPGVGPRVGYDFDTDHAFLGGQFNFPVGRRWALAPSADFYLGTTGTPYRLNVDVKFHPPTAYGFFYFGGGLAILHASGNTDTGANVFGGWEGRRYAPVKPFLEARFVFASNTSFNLLGGLNFPI